MSKRVRETFRNVSRQHKRSAGLLCLNDGVVVSVKICLFSLWVMGVWLDGPNLVWLTLQNSTKNNIRLFLN